MRIDCHCHIFNNDCVPIAGMLASRFGIAIGKRASRLIDDIKSGNSIGSWRDDLTDLSFDMQSIRSLFDFQEKDNLRFILEHIDNFLAFLKIGIMDIPRILEGMVQNASGIDVWVPLMMDMSHAYHPYRQPVCSFESQRKIMSQLTLDARGRIMPFYAFDPRSGPPDPVETLQEAIETQGFVGVKLYPPLGFKPMGNDDPAIEHALMRLYEYCCQNTKAPIPITSHCSWAAGVYSNERVPGINNIRTYYRDMAGPSHWEKALKRFPSLKLNLAHFGGLGEWEAMARGDTPHKNWVDPVTALIKHYDNVYTDFSYNGIPTTDLADAYRNIVLEKTRGIEQKLLLGSDWYMSRMQCSLNDYWQGFETLFPDLFDNMTGENAVSFLTSDAAMAYFPKFFNSNERNLLDQYKNLFTDE